MFSYQCSHITEIPKYLNQPQIKRTSGEVITPRLDMSVWECCIKLRRVSKTSEAIIENVSRSVGLSKIKIFNQGESFLVSVCFLLVSR